MQTITGITKLKISTVSLWEGERERQRAANHIPSTTFIHEHFILWTVCSCMHILLVCHWIEWKWKCHNLHHHAFSVHILNASRSILNRLIFNVNNKMEFHLFTCKLYLSMQCVCVIYFCPYCCCIFSHTRTYRSLMHWSHLRCWLRSAKISTIKPTYIYFYTAHLVHTGVILVLSIDTKIDTNKAENLHSICISMQLNVHSLLASFHC